MKYHTTVLNIIVSLGMLLGVCILVVALAGSALLPSIGNRLIDNFLVHLNGDTGIKISIGSMDGSFLKSMAIHDVSVTFPTHPMPVLTAETIIIDVPAYRLLFLDRIKNELPLILIQPVVELDQTDYDFIIQTSLFKMPNQNETGAVAQLPLTIQLVDGIFGIEMDEFQIQADSIQADVDFSSGFVPEQGTVSFKNGIFSSGLQSASIIDLEIRLGKTSDGSAGLVIAGNEGFLKLAELSSQGAIGSFSASMTSASNESLLQGTGLVVANLQSIKSELVYEGTAISASIPTLGIESGIEKLALSSLAFQAHQMLMRLSLPGLDGIELLIPGLSGGIETSPGNETTLRFDSGNRIESFIGEDSLVSIKDLAVVSRLTKDFSTVRIGFTALEFSNPDLFNSTTGLDLSILKTVFLSQAHVQMTLDRLTSENFAELSLHLQAETDLEPINSIDTYIFANGKMNQQYDSIQADIEIEKLSLSGIPGISEINLTYGRRSSTDHMLETVISHDSGIQLTGNYDLQTNQARATLRLENVHPSDFSTLIGKYIPSAINFYNAETVLEGNASATFHGDGSQGRGAAELGVAKVRIEDKSFNFATTIAGSFNPSQITVDSATITTEGIRATYKGFLDRFSLFPQGELFLGLAETGENLLSVDFSRSAAKTYEYIILSPRIPDVSLTGNVMLDSNRQLQANAMLMLPAISYPLTIYADTQNGLFNLESTAMSLLVDIASAPGHIGLQVKADRFPFPELTKPFLNGILYATGELAIDYALSDGTFLLSTQSLALSGLSWGGLNPWQLTVSLLADTTELRINDIEYRDDLGELSGYLKIANNPLHTLFNRELQDFSGILNLQNPFEPSESMMISVFNFPDETHVLRGQINANSLRTARFFPNISPLIFDFDAIGSSNLRDSIDLNISAALTGASGSPSDIDLTLDAVIDDTLIQVIDGRFDSGVFSLSGFNLKIPYQGISRMEGNLYIDLPSKYQDMHSTLDFGVETIFAPTSGFFSSIPVFQEALRKPISASITLSDIVLFGSLGISDGTYGISYDSRKISVSGGYRTNLSGYYDLDSNFLDLTATEDFLFGFHALGTLGADRISLLVDSISFPLNILNPLFIKPIMEFYEGVAHGELRVEGPSSNPKYYGTLWADTVSATTFWTPGAEISVKNPVVTVSENRASIASTPLFSTDLSGKTVTGYLNLEAGIERWGLTRYKLDLKLGENPIFVWIPIVDKDINLEAMVAGDFSIEGSATEELLTGELIISDGYLGFGLPELPAWLVPEQRTSIDMGFTTGKNFIFVYPNRESPIVQAAIADNQRMHIKLDAPTMNIGFDGELAIRSGEIYYVQKNFYITEGSILIKAAVGAAANEVNPVLNLRARLREFDKNGNRLDVFLVLQDSTLDNLAPRFESVPYRTTNEILEILGQGIIPGTKFEETGIGSVVALATVATDVISRLGIIQANATTYGFSQIIRDSLGLDVFTIRTNLLQNILYEAIPGTGTDNTVSPIARYLDNTTLYLGKYLLDDFYLQGMLHFRGNLFGANEGASFLSNDLAVDTEISLEWNTPLALFSIFTQPDVLSIFNIFDTIGFSVTKRIVF